MAEARSLTYRVFDVDTVAVAAGLSVWLRGLSILAGAGLARCTVPRAKAPPQETAQPALVQGRRHPVDNLTVLLECHLVVPVENQVRS